MVVGTSTHLQCDQCQKTYSSKSSLNHHKKTQHKQVVLLWKMDGEDIQGPSNPIKEKIVDFECNIKQQSIISNKLMVQEIVADITNLAWNDLGKIKCAVCHSKFSNSDSLTRHQRKFHNPPTEVIKKEYQCDICHKIFPKPSKLERHLSVHDKVKDYTCNVCKKEFPAPSKLKRHEKVHEPSNSDNRENVDSYPCDKCDKTYTQKRYMIKHMKTHEEFIKPVVFTNMHSKKLINNYNKKCFSVFLYLNNCSSCFVNICPTKSIFGS